MPCSVCGAPLFTWEAAGGLCREHALAGSEPHEGLVALQTNGEAFVEPNYRYDRLTALRDLGSIFPPLARTNSVRLVHRVLAPTEDELCAVVAAQQPLTPAMRGGLRLVTP